MKSSKLKLTKYFFIIAPLIILFLWIFNANKSNKLINQPVTVARMIEHRGGGNNQSILYSFQVKGREYFGLLSAINQKRIVVPDGKYLVVYNEEKPTINAVLLKRKADTLELNKVYDIKISKSEIVSALNATVTYSSMLKKLNKE